MRTYKQIGFGLVTAVALCAASATARDEDRPLNGRAFRVLVANNAPVPAAWNVTLTVDAHGQVRVNTGMTFESLGAPDESEKPGLRLTDADRGRAEVVGRLLWTLSVGVEVAPWEHGVILRESWLDGEDVEKPDTFVLKELTLAGATSQPLKSGEPPVMGGTPAVEGTKEEEKTVTHTPAADELIGRTFALRAFNGELFETAEGMRTPTVAFQDGMRVVGRNCNQFTGQGEYENGILKAKLAATLMMCVQQKLMDVEHAFSTMVNEGAAVTLAGDVLTLASADNKTTLEYKLLPAPTAP